MKKAAELKGKEVVDDFGNKIGEISGAKWNSKSNNVESLVITKRGSCQNRTWRKKDLSYTNVDSVGEKVVLN